MPQTQIKSLPLHARQGLFARILTALTAALARRRDRQRLAHLDAYLLRDIGIEAQDAQAECAKPFWKA
jgi:uncharacterized protein YjiS (DUF1127 family)